jgi:hypothetical protein
MRARAAAGVAHRAVSALDHRARGLRGLDDFLRLRLYGLRRRLGACRVDTTVSRAGSAATRCRRRAVLAHRRGVLARRGHGEGDDPNGNERKQLDSHAGTAVKGGDGLAPAEHSVPNVTRTPHGGTGATPERARGRRVASPSVVWLVVDPVPGLPGQLSPLVTMPAVESTSAASTRRTPRHDLISGDRGRSMSLSITRPATLDAWTYRPLPT